LLRAKDEQSDELSEQFKAYDWVAANKNEYFIQTEEQSLAFKKLMGHCMKPCLTNLQTSVIVTSESECLTNCMAKGQEVDALFRLWNADKDMKRYGGFKA